MLSGNYKVYTLQMIRMYGLEYVEYMVNDKELWKYTQKDYEDMVIERYDFIVNKKEVIRKNQEKLNNAS